MMITSSACWLVAGAAVAVGYAAGRASMRPALAAARVAAATRGQSGADIWALVERIKLEALGGATGPRGRARVGNAAVRRAVDAFTRSNGRHPRPGPVSSPSA